MAQCDVVMTDWLWNQPPADFTMEASDTYFMHMIHINSAELKRHVSFISAILASFMTAYIIKGRCWLD